MALELEDIAESAAKVARAIRQIFAKAKGIHGGIKGVWQTAPAIVKEVEKVASAWVGITGKDKKAMAVEAILLLIPPRWYLPKFVLRPLISWAIEAALKEIEKRRKYPPK